MHLLAVPGQVPSQAWLQPAKGRADIDIPAAGEPDATQLPDGDAMPVRNVNAQGIGARCTGMHVH